MDFDTDSNMLIKILLKSYTDYIENCMKETLKYELLLNKESFENFKITAIKDKKETICDFYPIGVYNLDSKEFKYSNTKNMILEHLYKYNMVDIFGSDNIIKKLFHDDVIKLSLKEHLIIPLLISIFNPAFDIVKFENDNYYMYAMIKLNIKCDFDWDNFLSEMGAYKSIGQLSQIYETKKRKDGKTNGGNKKNSKSKKSKISKTKNKNSKNKRKNSKTKSKNSKTKRKTSIK